MGFFVAIINLWLVAITRITIWINPMSKYKVTGPRVECTKIVKEDGVTIEETTIMKFYKSNYLRYSQVKTREIYDDLSAYRERKKIDENSFIIELEKKSGNYYSHFDDKKKERMTISVITLTDTYELLNNCPNMNIKEETLEEFTARGMITESENSGAKCVYIELSKKQLGIE